VAREGGGTVYVPAGQYRCGTLRLSSRLAFWIGAGAVLRMSERQKDFSPPETLPYPPYADRATSRFRYALLWGEELDHVTIRGEGRIDCGPKRSPPLCHGTVLNGYEISADWPGYFQQEMERRYPGMIALFVQGCGADINPLPRRSLELAQTYGRLLAIATEEVLQGRMRALEGPIRAAFELVDVPFQNPPSREQLQAGLKGPDATAARRAGFLLRRLDREGSLPSRYPYPVQVWQFRDGLKLIMLGGEVVVDYSLRLKQAYGFAGTWVAGYSNDVFAYIPSVRVLKEGGYEGGAGENIPYGLASPFAPEVEEIIVRKVDELIQRTKAPK